MTDPYRTGAERSETEDATPVPVSYPSSAKWSNPLWRRFFDVALGGASAWAVGVSSSPETVVVDAAEKIADEAWRRASTGGAPGTTTYATNERDFGR